MRESEKEKREREREKERREGEKERVRERAREARHKTYSSRPITPISSSRFIVPPSRIELCETHVGSPWKVSLPLGETFWLSDQVSGASGIKGEMKGVRPAPATLRHWSRARPPSPGSVCVSASPTSYPRPLLSTKTRPMSCSLRYKCIFSLCIALKERVGARVGGGKRQGTRERKLY